MRYALILILLTGCARFHTVQSDTSYDNQGKPTRTITTKVTALALFSANSELAKFRANQSDKTQSASVGSLNLLATNRVVETLQEVNKILEKVPK